MMWAIECNNPEYGPGDHFLGWAWFPEFIVPISTIGHVGSAFFPSRKMAREQLPRIRRSFPHAAVVKVKIVKG